VHPQLFLDFGIVAPAHPWFPEAGCRESNHFRQITHRLISYVIEHRPKGTMLVIKVARRTQYTGKGDRARSDESIPGDSREQAIRCTRRTVALGAGRSIQGTCHERARAAGVSPRIDRPPVGAKTLSFAPRVPTHRATAYLGSPITATVR